MATDKGLDFSKILVAKSIPYLTDYHLWFSTLIKPSDCHISRAQRLTCCLCLLMSYMALSIACYQYIGPRYRGEFSLIDISWQSIIVGISVIALPPTVLIISIFRRSKVHRNRFEENLSKDYDAKESDRHLSSSEDEPSGLSVFEQMMLSWQSLQEWAQKAWTKRYQQLPIGSTQNVKPVTIQNASDQQQPSMNFEKMDQSQTEDLMAGQLKPGEGVVVIILHPVSWNLYRRRRGISLCRQLVTIQTEAWQLPRLLCCSTSASFLWHHPSFGCSSWSRCASSPGTSSNRSSVKLTCSATSNCTKETPSKKWRCFLPYRSIYVGWSLCVILIMGCAAVTIYYGYRFSAAQSILWLQSVFFSFLHCIFITHLMIVLAIMLYSGLRYRNDMSISDHYSDGLITDKELAQDFVGVSSHEKQKLGHSASEPKTLAEGIAARQHLVICALLILHRNSASSKQDIRR